jgi:small subunit ribosomal protein S19
MSQSEDYRTGREGEFTYRGHDLDELQRMEREEVVELLPARQRRTIERGLSREHEDLLAAAEAADPEETANNPIRTHLRDMPILPAMVDITFAVYTGQSFERVRVEPEMIGHYLGEFQLTRTSVEHGQAGIGATRSSKFVPLK